MSRNPYSNLSHEELLKLLAEKDAQLEKSSTEIRTLREEKQVQKELMAQETERLQGKVYDLEQKNRQMTVKLAQMGLAVNEVLPVLQSFFDDLKLRDAFDPQDPEFEGTIRRIVDGYYKGFKAAATMVTYFCAGTNRRRFRRRDEGTQPNPPKIRDQVRGASKHQGKVVRLEGPPARRGR